MRHRYELVLVWLAVVVALAVAIGLGSRRRSLGITRTPMGILILRMRGSPGGGFSASSCWVSRDLRCAALALLEAAAASRMAVLSLALVVEAGVVFVWENFSIQTYYICA